MIMDSPEKQEAAQPIYVEQPGSPIQLVDGFVIENRGDLAILSVYLSDRKPPGDPASSKEVAENAPWISFCHGKFGMSKGALEMLRKLISDHLEKMESSEVKDELD